MRLLREPLVYFLALGTVLFILFGRAATGPTEARQHIVVQQGDLLLFVRHRFGKFGEGEAASYLNGLDEADRRKVIVDFVKEEALFREAHRLGLDRLDYTMRQRMVTRMLSIQREATINESEPTAAELKAFFASHRANYRLASFASFSAARYMGPQPGAWETAAVHWRMTEEDVSERFGSDAAIAIFSASSASDVWSDPIETPEGRLLRFHVDTVTRGREPTLEEVREKVLNDFNLARWWTAQEDLQQKVLSQYDVRLSPRLEAEIGPWQ